MNIEEICNELLTLADKQEQTIAAKFPVQSIHRVALFIETVRAIDMLSLININTKDPDDAANFDILRMGWNLAAFYLLQPLEVRGFPMAKGSEAIQNFAAAILRGLGSCVHARRTVDMIKAGTVAVEKRGATFIFKKTGADSEHIDMLEYTYLNKLQEDILSKKRNNTSWGTVSTTNIEEVINLPGSHLGMDNEKRFAKYQLTDIETHMLPLLSSWEFNGNLMMAYETTREIDEHFLSLSADIVFNWQEDAGIHPKTKIGSFTGHDLTAIVLDLVSINMKHIQFTNVAKQKFPEMLLFQNLTLWKIKEELTSEIAAYTGLDIALITDIFDVITLKPNDVSLFKKHSSLFMPLLIDFGNGFVLRPVSSISRNPFYSILALLEHRDPNSRHEVSLHREEWLRQDLYAYFEGNRYQRVNGNINLKKQGKVITDIDAAIYDNTNGELAIFQIKWQDYFFNDVKKLRSKASNLARELDDWSEKVMDWVNDNGNEQLTKLLRIKLPAGTNISAIYLFGLSKNAGRTAGYGFVKKSTNLAVATWPQFQRNRIEIGPQAKVFSVLFKKLIEQEGAVFKSTPIPVSFQLSEHELIFEDIWYTYEKNA
jgi:hypothetical protein